MKQNKALAQRLQDRNISQVLCIAVITVAALFITSGLAQSFNGFASYQDYLNNYYAQNQQFQNRTTTFTPIATVQVTPFNTTTPYNGFASYQAYLDNFYAGQNLRTTTVNPCGFQGLRALFIYGNNNCVSDTSTPRFTNTGPFNGYPSYQAYLDAFYAGTVSQRVLPNNNNSVLNNSYAYGSYDNFMRALYPNYNTAAPRAGTLAPLPNNFQAYSSYDDFMRALYPNYNTPGARAGTLAPINPTPSPRVNGNFEFSVGQPYQFSNGLIMTVQTLNDNRCPLNVQCVWQGDIAATVRLEMGNDIRTVTVSMVVGNEAPQVVVNNASIQFLGLGSTNNTLNTFVSVN